MHVPKFFLLLAGLLLTLAGAAATQDSSSAKAGENTSTAAEVAKGRKIFNMQCAICHYSLSEAKKIGPGMKGLVKRGSYAGGKPVDDASLRVWIEKGGKDMPAFKDSLNAEQIRDLITYLKTL